MRIDIATLFPDMCETILNESILGRARRHSRNRRPVRAYPSCSRGEEISIGDYVLTGGELPALVLADAVARMCHGVLAARECYEEESHMGGLLEYPQYTRPEEWRGQRVPEVLLSGHHKNIADWRLAQRLVRTKEKRPDLYKEYPIGRKEKKLLEKYAEDIGTKEKK